MLLTLAFLMNLATGRTSALSETSRTKFLAILCRKVRPKFGRTELPIVHYSNVIIYIYYYIRQELFGIFSLERLPSMANNLLVYFDLFSTHFFHVSLLLDCYPMT